MEVDAAAAPAAAAPAVLGPPPSLGPVLSALEQGFEVYVITDASGDISEEAHERAVTRMIQAGARPITALQYLLELQRDWARGDTYDLTTGIARQWGAASATSSLKSNGESTLTRESFSGHE